MLRLALLGSLGIFLVGCDWSGGEAYECVPPPCPPNALCTNQCGDIIALDVPSGRQRNLTETRSIFEGGASWSPSGREVAFGANEEGRRTIYTMAADGTGRRPVTGRDMNAFDPVWSPDGSRIAFHGLGSDGEQHLYIINADGSAVRQLPDGLAGSTPAWSPDGGALAFTLPSSPQSTIYLIRVDGTGLRRIAALPGWINEVAWSPDGTRLAFSTDHFDSADVWTVNADGSDLKRLASGAGYNRYPAWSPDGRRLAYIFEQDGESELYTMAADGSDAQRLTGGSGYISMPAWSPDGSQIAFSAYRGVQVDLYVVGASGGRRAAANP